MPGDPNCTILFNCAFSSAKAFSQILKLLSNARHSISKYLILQYAIVQFGYSYHLMPRIFISKRTLMAQMRQWAVIQQIINNAHFCLVTLIKDKNIFMSIAKVIFVMLLYQLKNNAELIMCQPLT